MKTFVVLLIVIIPSVSFGINFSAQPKGAFGAGFAKDGLQIELIIQKSDTQSIHFALASNTLWDGSKGEQKSEQLWNYGRTVDGTGGGFYLFDIGWGYIFSSKVRLASELTFLWEYEYTNYKDARFKEGGYHMIDDKEFQLEIGTTASYIINHKYELYSGYNSFKKFNAGMRFIF